jgi:glycogen synthase
MSFKVLFIASECAPIAKVGGLADVVGSLPKTLKKIGVNASIVIPFYGVISIKDKNLKLFPQNFSISGMKNKPLNFRFSSKVTEISSIDRTCTHSPGCRFKVSFSEEVAEIMRSL